MKDFNKPEQLRNIIILKEQKEEEDFSLFPFQFWRWKRNRYPIVLERRWDDGDLGTDHVFHSPSSFVFEGPLEIGGKGISSLSFLGGEKTEVEKEKEEEREEEGEEEREEKESTDPI